MLPGIINAPLCVRVCGGVYVPSCDFMPVTAVCHVQNVFTRARTAVITQTGGRGRLFPLRNRCVINVLLTSHRQVQHAAHIYVLFHTHICICMYVRIYV